MTRREWLRIGGLGLGGLSLAGLLQGQAQATPAPRRSGKAKAVIVFGLVGGPPQHETWDPKPKAPAEIRGQFGVIPTKTPGLFIGELMPPTAVALCWIRSTGIWIVSRVVALSRGFRCTRRNRWIWSVPPRRAKPATWARNRPRSASATAVAVLRRACCWHAAWSRPVSPW